MGRRVFRPRDDAVIRFRFVHDHADDFDIERMWIRSVGR